MEKIEMMGVQSWIDEIRNAGLLEKIPEFNDVTTGKTKPVQDIEPVVSNVQLGGKTVDIYHWGASERRLYLHIKG